MHPIGKHYKSKFIELSDSTLKPIPGSDSHKFNQTHCDSHLPPYVIDQHQMNQHMLMCVQVNDSADSDDSTMDTTSKLFIETK